MEKRVKHRTRTLGGLLAGYLLRTGLACAAVAVVWFALVLVLIEAGFILPANSAARAAQQAAELLPAMLTPALCPTCAAGSCWTPAPPPAALPQPGTCWPPT